MKKKNVIDNWQCLKAAAWLSSGKWGFVRLTSSECWVIESKLTVNTNSVKHLMFFITFNFLCWILVFAKFPSFIFFYYLSMSLSKRYLHTKSKVSSYSETLADPALSTLSGYFLRFRKSSCPNVFELFLPYHTLIHENDSNRLGFIYIFLPFHFVSFLIRKWTKIVYFLFLMEIPNTLGLIIVSHQLFSKPIKLIHHKQVGTVYTKKFVFRSRSYKI